MVAFSLFLRFLKWKMDGKWKMENGNRIHHPCVLLRSRGAVCQVAASVQGYLSHQESTTVRRVPEARIARGLPNQDKRRPWRTPSIGHALVTSKSGASQGGRPADDNPYLRFADSPYIFRFLEAVTKWTAADFTSI
jgi:hypothetical protein